MKFIKFAIAAWACIIANLVCAQNFPKRPVTLVVPSAAGGGNTTIARLLEKGLSDSWGQPVVVVFKPGVGSVLATDFVAKSTPDGHTIGLVITAHVINPSMRHNMPFDTLKDLSGVTMIAVSPILISATNSLPVNSIKELIALSKNPSSKLSYSSPGIGSAMHMGGELLKLETGADILHVPYYRAVDAYTDLYTGRIQIQIGTLFAALPYIKSGKMKPIALMSSRRSPLLPETPLVAETLPGFVVESMVGIVAPSATPRDVIEQISADIAKVLHSPAVRQRMLEVGLLPVGNKPEDFDAYIRAEISKWAKVVKASGVTPD